MTHNTLTAERALLGCLLLDAGLVDEYRDRLDPAGLHQASHGRILGHILALHAAGIPADTVTIFERIHAAKDANQCGGLEYVQALPEQVPSAKGFKGYLRQVEDAATRRRVHAAAVDLQRAAADTESTVEQMLDEAERALSDIAPSSNAAMKDSHDTADEAWMALEKRMDEHKTGAPSWMPTGIDDLDRMIAPSLRGGKQIVVAARPAMGKSALGQQMCMGIARAGYGVGFFSLEMSTSDLVHRGWAMTSGVHLDRFTHGNPRRDEQDKIEDAMGEWMELPLHISDSSNQTLSSIRSQTRRLQMAMARKGTKLGAICVDYIGLMGFDSGAKRHEAIGEISRGLKRLARELDIATIILSQLNRKVEERSNKRPLVSDLRDSGDVEQDADLILFIYREGYYREDCENPNEAEVICAKQRSGPTGTVKLHWQGECTRFLPLGSRYS